MQRIFAVVVHGVRAQAAGQEQPQRGVVRRAQCRRRVAIAAPDGAADPQVVGLSKQRRQLRSGLAPLFGRPFGQDAQRLAVGESFQQLRCRVSVAGHAGTDPAVDVAHGVFPGPVSPQQLGQRMAVEADCDSQRRAAVAIPELHLRAVFEQDFHQRRIVVQHHRLVQAVALAAPDAHRPVGIAAMLQQQPRQFQIVVAQRVRQGVADVPLRRLGGEQRLEAGHVLAPHRVPHGAALVQRRPVGHVRASVDERLRQRRIARAADGRAERGAIAANSLGFAHARIDVCAQSHQFARDPHAAFVRASLESKPRTAQIEQRRPAKGRQAFVDGLGGESGGGLGVGKAQGASGRIRGERRPAFGQCLGALAITRKQCADQRLFRILGCHLGRVRFHARASYGSR